MIFIQPILNFPAATAAQPILLRGSYHILRAVPLGFGSSTVYLAVDKRNQRSVACKAIKRGPSRSESWIFDEIRTLKGINHRNIIRLYDCEEDEDYIFLFFQRCDTDLRRYLEAHIRLDHSETKGIMWQILQGLNYLHSVGILHCDIKLENILLQFKPVHTIRIADFEFALRESMNEYCPGTISYLPPEAIRALDNSEMKYLSKPSDCWSAGVILFCMISGFHPFQCLGVQATKTKVLRGILKFESSAAYHLLSMLCHPDPTCRATIADATKHVWFQERESRRSTTISRTRS
ncbi:kinase-like domain-containing protein [Mycena olivaceomarginata]|nr:kinase-like domain-containing protein [Mycena olivaceomarginata]